MADLGDMPPEIRDLHLKQSDKYYSEKMLLFSILEDAIARLQKWGKREEAVRWFLDVDDPDYEYLLTSFPGVCDALGVVNPKQAGLFVVKRYKLKVYKPIWHIAQYYRAMVRIMKLKRKQT